MFRMFESKLNSNNFFNLLRNHKKMPDQHDFTLNTKIVYVHRCKKLSYNTKKQNKHKNKQKNSSLKNKNENE